MTLTAGDARDGDGVTSTTPMARRPERGPRRSMFSPPDNAHTPDDAATDSERDSERHELIGGDLLVDFRRRQQERKAYALTHGERPLPIVDSDGHVVLPPELLAKQAAEAAAAEAERIAGLTPARLDAVQMRRWTEWCANYELHRPTYLRLGIGPRGEMLMRQRFAPFIWEDDDERHPDGPHIVLDSQSGQSDVRAFPNEQVLDAIRQQYLIGWWRSSESNKPTPPTPLTINQRIAAMAEEREARAAAKRRPDYNRRLIIGGGRGW